MTTTTHPTDGYQVREFDTAIATRNASDGTGRSFTGLAVPFDDEIQLLPGLYESVAPGAISRNDGKLFWRHHELIGRITDARETEAGWLIDATISDTSLGRDALALLQDGAIDRLSIGFEPIAATETKDADGNLHIRHTSIRIREVSLVPHPAYENAAITEHRKAPAMTETATETRDVDAIALELADLKRAMSTLTVTPREPAPDQRSAGQLLRAAARDGDETAIETLNRAYTGGTSADDFGKATWVKDLTQLVEQADELADVFADAPLPDTGMSLEFGQLKANTVKVARQKKEGDTIVQGNLSVETETVPVETYAGGSRLTIQEIKRSQAPLVDMHLRALALEAGKARATAKLEAVNATIAAQNAAGVQLGTGDTWAAWVDPMVKAVQALKPLGLALNGLLLPEADWVKMAKWADADGRPILTPTSPARDAGTFAIKTLDGQLLTVPTRMVTGLSSPAFFNSNAVRHYTSPLVRLTDSEAFTLTEDIAVYQFGAVAVEIPGAIIPVTAAAA